MSGGSYIPAFYNNAMNCFSSLPPIFFKKNHFSFSPSIPERDTVGNIINKILSYFVNISSDFNLEALNSFA